MQSLLVILLSIFLVLPAMSANAVSKKSQKSKQTKPVKKSAAKARAKKTTTKITPPKKVPAPKMQTENITSQNVAPLEKASIKPTKQRGTELNYSFTLELTTWQETVEAKSGALSGSMETKSKGILLSYDYEVPFDPPRWSYYLSPRFGFGSIKGQIQLGSIPDGLEDQNWFLIGGAVGLVYRTSAVGSIGFGIPVDYRSIIWSVKPGSSLKPEKESTVSVGVNTYLEFNLSDDNTIRTTVTYHALWDAAMWGIAWNKAFNEN